MAQAIFEAIGTHWQIDIYQEASEAKASEAFARVRERIEIFDKAYSRFRPDSLVTEMAARAGTYALPEDAEPMIGLYQDLYRRTGGKVTPLVGNLIADAGYDAKYSLQKNRELSAPPRWEDVLDYQAPNLTLKQPALLDFGAAGKGYLVDLVAEVLEAQGISRYCVDAGGDILYKNDVPIRVGLENPDDASEVVGVCTLAKGSLCGSSGNRRAWGEFTHIIDPVSLASPSHLKAVWVTAASAMLADGLATALFFAEPSALAGYPFEYALIRSDNSIELSAGFPGEAFTA